VICERRGEEFRQASKYTPRKIALIPVLYMNKQEMHPVGLSTDVSLFAVSSVIFACLLVPCGGAGLGPLPSCRLAEPTGTSRSLQMLRAASFLMKVCSLVLLCYKGQRAPARKVQRERSPSIALADPSVSGRLILFRKSVFLLLKYHTFSFQDKKTGSGNFLFSFKKGKKYFIVSDSAATFQSGIKKTLLKTSSFT